MKLQRKVWRYENPDPKFIKLEKKPAKKSHIALPPPPVDECVPEIPTLSAEYIQFLSKLKNEAFEVAQTLNVNSNIPGPSKVSDYTQTSGYLAFASFYKYEFYNLPRQIALKYIGPAWCACEDQHVWNFYALQYNSYHRNVDFSTWLEGVRKIKMVGAVFFLAPESFDPELSESAAQSPMGARQNWKFVTYKIS